MLTNTTSDKTFPNQNVPGCMAKTSLFRATIMVDLCLPVSDVASRQHLRSASRRLLVIPRHRLRTYGRRAFSVAGPSAWNSLPDNLRDSSVSRDSFCKLLKSYLFNLYWNIERIRGFTRMRYTNLLTYSAAYPGAATCIRIHNKMSTDTCRRIQVARPG